MTQVSVSVRHRPLGPWRGRYVLLRSYQPVSHHWALTPRSARRKALTAASHILERDLTAVYVP